MGICVATTTFYKNSDDLRLKLTLRTLNALHEAQISVVVVDGSPNDEVKKKLQATGAIVIREVLGTTMGAGRRQALREADRAISIDHVVFWMEPEKYPIVPFIRQICAPIQEGEADIVVPRRADELSSYPKTQRLAEQCGNAIFEAVTGLALDVWIGPRAINVKGLAHFTKYDGAYGDKWQSIFMPLLTAAKDGLRLTEVVVDYVHPPEQTEVENRDTNLSIVKRLEQLHELGNALVEQAQAIGLTS